MDTGASFVKKIGFVGCAVFVLLFVVFMVFCFSTKAPLEGYKAEHDTEYYSEHLDELKTELETKLFPRLSGIEDCSLTGDKLTVVISSESFDESYKIIKHYYSLELLNIEKSSEGVT